MTPKIAWNLGIIGKWTFYEAIKEKIGQIKKIGCYVKTMQVYLKEQKS